jgi:hypothetical protein
MGRRRQQIIPMAKRIYPLLIQPWSAVRIATHGDTCDKALALRDKRFLARDAPALPLKGCTLSAGCNCIYRHYADRRAGQRRDAAPTASRSGRPPAERRGARNRRGSD